MSEVERRVSKKELEKLIGLGERCDHDASAARQPLKGEVEKLKKKGLNPWAFNVLRQLAKTYKSNPAKAAHNIRALDLYIDQLGYRAQLDIEDAIDEEERKPNGRTLERRIAADAAEEAAGNVVPLNGAKKRKRGRRKAEEAH